MKKPFRKVKLEGGPFTGKTVIFETPGKTVKVVCNICGWSDWQTFFVESFTVKDIGRECDECGSKDFHFEELDS